MSGTVDNPGGRQTPDLREQITALFRSGSLYKGSPKAIADEVLAVVEPLLAEVEASRRDWAAEAARLDVVIDSVAAEYDELAEKADLQIGEHADALMAWGCWRNAARKLRKAAVHPDSNGGAQ
jgi:signal transduction protein with GAF and PtsI domain